MTTCWQKLRWQNLSRLSQRRVVSISILVLVTTVLSAIVLEALYITRQKAFVPHVRGGGSAISEVYNQWVISFLKDSGLSMWVEYGDTNGTIGWNDYNNHLLTFAGTDFPEVTSLGGNPSDYIVFTFVRGALQLATSTELMSPPCDQASVNLTLPLVAAIYDKSILYWNDSRLLAHNPCLATNVVKPEILALHRTGVSSATFALTKSLYSYSNDPNWAAPSYNWPLNYANPLNMILRKNDHMVYAISSFENALGYYYYYYDDGAAPVRAVTLINDGNYSVQLTPESLRNGARVTPPTDQPHNVTCPNCWPLISSAYITMKKYTKIEEHRIRDTTLPDSCVNLQGALKFFRYVLNKTPGQSTTDLRYVMPHTEDIMAFENSIKDLTCNSYNLLHYDFDRRRRLIIFRNMSLAALAVIGVTIALGSWLIVSRERQFKSDLKKLAQMTDEDMWAMGSSSELMKDMSPQDYDDNTGFAAVTITPGLAASGKLEGTPPPHVHDSHMVALESDASSSADGTGSGLSAQSCSSHVDLKSSSELLLGDSSILPLDTDPSPSRPTGYDPHTTPTASKGGSGTPRKGGSGSSGSHSKGDGSSASSSTSALSGSQMNKLVSCMVDAGALTLGKSIGSGCFGEVFAGLYSSMTVAIKRIQTSYDPVKTQSFLQEISAMETLKHENVVRLYAIAIKSPYTYIVTEFCKFGSLQDVFDKHPEKLTTQIKLDMMKGAAAGMAYIHGRGFAHRDLKLSNMLVTTNMVLKIGDLGTATSGAQVLRSRVGTPDFCAPEILDGQPYTKACDIYSYAICLWVLFSGQPLYPGMTFVDMISKIVPGYRPDLEPILSPKLRALISQCWHKDPEKRPSFQQIYAAISTIDASDFVGA